MDTVMDTIKTRIIQITDTHLFGDADASLMGVHTRETLNAVLDLIEREFADFECLLVTGDLTQDGSASSCEYLKTALTNLGKPFYWLCGNHDSFEIMATVAPEAMVRRIPVDNWQILMLHSQVSGSVHGHLGSAELQILDNYLHEYPCLHTMIAFHHHPDALDSRWIDEIALDNPADLRNIINQYQQVKAIIHGHAHQENEYIFANTPVLATPSTCLQFTPNSDNFQIDQSLPGFRVVDLLPDGSFKTQVVRLQDFPMEIDKTANGY